MRRLPVAAGALAGTGTVYAALVTGRLTLDLGIGRRTRPLGPLTVDIGAPPAVAFQAAAAPYAERRPRHLREKVAILERSDRMLLAAHRTPVGGGLTAVTVETVRLDPPHTIGFRLVRGPVPHVVETFRFEAAGAGTRLRYDGELGTDLGPVGAAWGRLVARSWVATVARSLDAIKTESERRAG